MAHVVFPATDEPALLALALALVLALALAELWVSLVFVLVCSF